MKRDFLESLGLDKAGIDAIMTENGKRAAGGRVPERFSGESAAGSGRRIETAGAEAGCSSRPERSETK